MSEKLYRRLDVIQDNIDHDLNNNSSTYGKGIVLVMLLLAFSSGLFFGSGLYQYTKPVADDFINEYLVDNPENMNQSFDRSDVVHRVWVNGMRINLVEKYHPKLTEVRDNRTVAAYVGLHDPPFDIYMRINREEEEFMETCNHEWLHEKHPDLSESHVSRLDDEVRFSECDRLKKQLKEDGVFSKITR